MRRTLLALTLALALVLGVASIHSRGADGRNRGFSGDLVGTPRGVASVLPDPATGTWFAKAAGQTQYRAYRSRAAAEKAAGTP